MGVCGGIKFLLYDKHWCPLFRARTCSICLENSSYTPPSCFSLSVLKAAHQQWYYHLPCYVCGLLLYYVLKRRVYPCGTRGSILYSYCLVLNVALRKNLIHWIKGPAFFCFVLSFQGCDPLGVKSNQMWRRNAVSGMKHTADDFFYSRSL